MQPKLIRDSFLEDSYKKGAELINLSTTEFLADVEIKLSSSQFILLANTLGKFITSIIASCFKKKGPLNHKSRADFFIRPGLYAIFAEFRSLGK